MSEELFDLEIKKSFDEEFDAQDIFVSEDLIAKTMAAIKSIDKDTTENDNYVFLSKFVYEFVKYSNIVFYVYSIIHLL